ncbi:MAG: glutathione peroxidase [Bacteroidetes bacterium]|nr:MAG: glutathione peroxidase [Bacteroidota bacterium]
MKPTLALLLFALMAFAPPAANLYQFKPLDINGTQMDLSLYKGKKILIVNTASKCGYTYQYADLQKLADTYKTKLVVIGFPANNFGGQEPGTNAEIKTFCSSKYDVTFPMAAKVSVKGSDIDPLFKWLTTKSENGVLDANISWNFNKFLLDENGKLLQHYGSSVDPNSEAITKYLK